MEVVISINYIVSLVFTVCFFYQFIYVIVGLFTGPKKFVAKTKHRYGIIISARNEENVIPYLIDSLKGQSYPSELIDIFVVADNCSDGTAEVARKHGAIVYERFDNEFVGKGYALDWLFKRIFKDYADKKHDAYIAFDADNLVEPDFVEEMNKVFDNGYNVITSYRNSKNYGRNWITAGYSLWFLREAKFLNNSRMNLKTSCAISGTGFLVSREIVEKNGGWIHHLLTEDIEFTTDSVIHGEKIGYCGTAMLYDEQPTTFKQSYKQRLRWAKGFYQVLHRYGLKLIKGVFKGSFSCYDILITIMPAVLLTIITVFVNATAIPVAALSNSPMLMEVVKSLFLSLSGFYCVFFFMGLLTIVTEWKKINCANWQKIVYTFTFPLFMFTYVPISIIALFKKVKWDPIAHTESKGLAEIRR